LFFAGIVFLAVSVVSAEKTSEKPAVESAAYVFFHDMGKTSFYGNGSKIELDFKQVKEGKASLRIELNSAQWSAVMIQLPKSANLKELRSNNGSLTFWIRTDQEKPPLKIELVDSDADGKVTEIMLDLSAYAQLSKKKWEEVTIPLSYFSDKGVYWDGVEHHFDEPFQWDQVSQVRFQCAPSDEVPPPTYKFNVDEIRITK
jgi:hypothetical protein